MRRSRIEYCNWLAYQGSIRDSQIEHYLLKAAHIKCCILIPRKHCSERIINSYNGLHIRRISVYASCMMIKQKETDTKYKVCNEQFPNCQLPSHPTFTRVDGRLREISSFAISNKGMRHPWTVRMLETEECVLDRFERPSSTSAPAVAAYDCVSHSMMRRVLRKEGIHSSHLQKVRLKVDSYPHSLDFLRWMMQMKMNKPQFLVIALFTDETSFIRKNIFNIHNERVWAESSPHLSASPKY